MPNYLVLIVGVVLIELMLCFAFGLPDSLVHYGSRAADMVFAEYQYMLMGSTDEDGELIETAEESAERIPASSFGPIFIDSGEIPASAASFLMINASR
jgi:putative ABC transport system permease protein